MSWSDVFGGLFSGIGNNIGAIGQGAGLLGGGALVNESYQNIGNVGQTALEKSNALAQQALNQTQFRPFTVTTGLGNLQATPEGGYGMSLSPQQQALQDQLFGGAQGFYGQATQPLQQRTQDVYNQLRAMQTPEEQRQQLALEERLLGQGRLGLNTAQFGGSPEQFALAKAKEEAKNQAAFAAMEQAQREQAQAAELGRQFQTGGYLPMNALISAYNPGLQGAQLASEMQRGGAGLFGEAAMGGINALLASRLAQGNLAGQLGQALIGGSMQGMLSQQQEQGSSALGSAAGRFFDWLGGLGGGNNNNNSGGNATSGGSTSGFNTSLANDILNGRLRTEFSPFTQNLGGN